MNGSAVDLVGAALALEKFAVSRLISLFEDRRPSAVQQRIEVLELLDQRSLTTGEANNGDVVGERGERAASGVVLGVTGTPGSGKSSLLSRLTVDLLSREPSLSIAVLAVDPSSQVSGGSLLGDRTRMRFVPDERRLFFRSQAAESDLGGLGPSSFQVCRLLTRLFDCVFIETVGIGQSEADIRHLADRVYLVLQPLGGDEVQFLKAGIIEIPHAFILNKSDEPASDQSYHQLRASMWLARPFDEAEPPIFRTSAISGDGLEPLEDDMVAAIKARDATTLADREPYFLDRWVDDEWGRAGHRFLNDNLGGAAAFLAVSGGYDRSQIAFSKQFSVREV